MPDPHPEWIDLVVKLTPALFTLVVGSVGALIGYQQYRLNRDKLRLDLREKRLAAYESLQRYFGVLLRDGRVKDETLPILWEARSRARFLFGPEIKTYHEELWRKATQMHSAHTKMYDSQGISTPFSPERSAACDQHHEILVWKMHEMENVDSKFVKYLHFD